MPGQQRIDDFAADLLAASRLRVDDPFAADLAAASQPADKRSGFAKAVDVATTPLVPQIATWGRQLADVADTAPRQVEGGILDALKAIPDVLKFAHRDPLEARRAFGAGLIEGVGNVAAQLTSPLDATLTVLGLKGLRTAAGIVGEISRRGLQMGSAALAARGAERAIDADSPAEVGAGTLQALLGAAGMQNMRPPAPQPTPRPHIRGRLMSAPFQVMPEGGAVPPGRTLPDIDLRASSAGTYGPELPAGRRAPVIDFDANGNPVYSGDAEAFNVTASRRPRALLPESAESLDEFVPVPGGKVARRGEVTPGASLVDEAGIVDPFAADLAAVATPAAAPTKGRKGKATAPPKDTSLVPAAVMQREFDGRDVTRKVYSSDPTATDAPMLQATPDEAYQLRHMLAEMESIEYTPRTFNEVEVGRGGAYDVVGGGAGARVYQDVVKGYTSPPTREAVTQGIRDALEGKHSALGQRALHIARARQSGDPSVSAPQLPPDAGDLRQTGQQTDTDFNEFDRFVNRLSDEGIEDLGGLGEAGRVPAMLAARLGTGTAGAFAGVGTADEDDSTGEKILRGTLGFAAGVAAPSLLRGQLRSVTPGGPGAAAGGPTPIRAANLSPRSSVTEPFRARTDPMHGVDVFLGKMPDELRAGVQEVITNNGGFDRQRRGVLNHDAIARLAEGVQVDASARLAPGTALNAEAIRAFTDSVATVQQKVQQLSQRIAAGQGTDADVLALEAARAEATTLSASIMGARSEAGRALAEFRVMARVLRSADPSVMQEAAEGLRGRAAQFASQFNALPDDPLLRYRWLQQQSKVGVMDKARSVYYANILSGLKTHERNILGNVSNVVTSLVTHPFTVAADVARSAVKGTPRTATLSEIKPQAIGALVGLERGFADALFTLRHGVNPRALSGSLEAAAAGKFDVPRVELRGGGANPFNWPGRALDAGDALFRRAAYQQELHGLAAHQARSEGLRGEAFTQRMEALTTGTDPMALQLQEKAGTFAQRQVFQEKGGPITQWLQHGVKAFPPLAFVVPFVRTPANIFRQGAEFSPAGFAMKATRQGERTGAQALGRATAGTVALGYLAYLASTGRLSGAAPADAAERAQLLESGWRPNSIKIGDTWVSYSLFQPVSVPASVVANAFQSWQAAGGDAATADKIVNTVRGTLRSQLDQSFVSGVADVIEALEETSGTGGKASRVAGRLVSSAVPFTGTLRTIRDVMDPMVRRPETIGETVKAGIPGLSASMPARMDRFGEDIRREGGPLRRAADPFNVSSVSDDPVLAELGRLKVSMGFASDKVGGLTLTREQERGLLKDKGAAVRRNLEAAMSTLAYQQLSDLEKANVLSQVIENSRSATGRAYRDALLRQLGAR